MAEDKFGSFTENVFKVAVIGLAIITIVTYLLKQLGVIQADFAPGGGIILLVVALVLMIAYGMFVKKGTAFDLKEDFIPLIVSVALLVGAIYFLPKFLPNIFGILNVYSNGTIQIQGVVQSIVGGIG